MTIDVSKIKEGDTVTVYISADADHDDAGRYVTGTAEPGYDHYGLVVGKARWYLDLNRVVSHAPAEPERPDWADALVCRWANGALWVRRDDGFYFWNDRGPYDLNYLSQQQMTVIIDKDGNNVEAAV
jgi:hypothetical protein